MTNYLITGTKKVDYTNKDNRHIQGWNVFLTAPIPEDQGTGNETISVFISPERLAKLSANIKLNSTVNVLYNRFGGLEDIVFAPTK